MRNKEAFADAAPRQTGLQKLVTAVSCLLTMGLLWMMLGTSGGETAAVQANTQVMDKFDMHVTDQVSQILDGVIPIRRVYQLSDSDLAAPEPDPACFGQAEDPAQLQWLLDQAEPLLEGQTTLFTTGTSIKEGSQVHYYLDDTIFAVTWKQAVDDCVYTFSEVRIAHASQLRRFFSEGRFDSGVLHTTTEMSQSVNAVVAASGDYYGYRSIGIVVNGGQVYRDRGHYLDTCFIDDQGDLLFSYAGQITDKAAAEAYVEENNVRFSLSFGPVMILDGRCCVPDTYNSGEINDPYARAALCQMDKLHYVVVAANSEDPYFGVPTVAEFAWHLADMGIPTAYALDGGQTAAIVMGDELINTVSYGAQREISDIFYFATALPEKQREVDE